MWRCRMSQISQTTAGLSGFVFFHTIWKKFQKVVQKAGTGWCLHLWLIDLKRGHFWSSFRIMRQTTKAHWACPDPQILFVKSDYFSGQKKKEEKDRICKVLFCQSQRKERFAQTPRILGDDSHPGSGVELQVGDPNCTVFLISHVLSNIIIKLTLPVDCVSLRVVKTGIPSFQTMRRRGWRSTKMLGTRCRWGWSKQIELGLLLIVTERLPGTCTRSIIPDRWKSRNYLGHPKFIRHNPHFLILQKWYRFGVDCRLSWASWRPPVY